MLEVTAKPYSRTSGSRHEKPRVVFGMPVYNQLHENQLEASIESILAQTWKDFELVIVDDASTDGTWELVKRVSQQDSRIRAFQNKERLGSIRNFRRCFELAKPTGFFAWASQHDRYEPDWLVEMLEALQNDSQIALAYSFVSQHNEAGQTRNLPFHEFETVGLEVHERVLKTIWAHEGAGSMVYGLFRSNILERCGVYRDLLFPDIQLLIELAFWGSVRQVPRVLWHRRVDGSYHLSRQLRSGFTHPPWYTRFSVQLVNSGALLWHRCLSRKAGSLALRRWGCIAAREYFLANPRYRKNIERRRAFWLTREFLYGDFHIPEKEQDMAVPGLDQSAHVEGESHLIEIEAQFKRTQKKLLEKLTLERRLREEMSGEIDRLKNRLIALQRRHLEVIAKQSEVSSKPGAVGSDLSNQLQTTIHKLKQVRELRSRDQAQINALENKLTDVERKYRQLLKTKSIQALDPLIFKVIDSVREVVARSLDGPTTREHIAAYHSTLEKKGYDIVWQERMQRIQRVIESGENDLMRALQIVRGHEEDRREMGLDVRRWVINDQYIDLPWRPAAAAYRSAVFEAVIASVRVNTTKIIETGSGWGEHLCNIFLNGGPYDATYYACELEEEGRKCALMLAALNPLFRLEAHFFDYLDPDYSTIPTDTEHTILLTAHSIEQVAHIHKNCIRGALNLGRQVSGIHFEPVGWQTQTHDCMSEVSQAHRARCLELHYNENLWSLLKTYESEGFIKILKCVPNMIGLDYNPATLIFWEKVVED